jgi:hypothetical protein
MKTGLICVKRRLEFNCPVFRGAHRSDSATVFQHQTFHPLSLKPSGPLTVRRAYFIGGDLIEIKGMRAATSAS